MGKKAKLKEIRRIANQLPQLMVQKIEVEHVSGTDLNKEGIKEVEGKPVDYKANYSRKKVVGAPMNHNRKMKRLYNKYGVSVLGTYVNAVKQSASANANNGQ